MSGTTDPARDGWTRWLFPSVRDRNVLAFGMFGAMLVTAGITYLYYAIWPETERSLREQVVGKCGDALLAAAQEPYSREMRGGVEYWYYPARYKASLTGVSNMSATVFVRDGCAVDLVTLNADRPWKPLVP